MAPIEQDIANARQVGGAHYKKAAYIHWDWVINTGMSYLAGYATKYIVRWKDKGGVQDLRKAKHIIEKMIEVAPMLMAQRTLPIHWIRCETNEFLEQNNIDGYERIICRELATWQSKADLKHAHKAIINLIEEYHNNESIIVQNTEHEIARPTITKPISVG